MGRGPKWARGTIGLTN